jgi:hypothetical protein
MEAKREMRTKKKADKKTATPRSQTPLRNPVEEALMNTDRLVREFMGRKDTDIWGLPPMKPDMLAQVQQLVCLYKLRYGPYRRFICVFICVFVCVFICVFICVLRPDLEVQGARLV